MYTMNNSFLFGIAILIFLTGCTTTQIQQTDQKSSLSQNLPVNEEPETTLSEPVVEEQSVKEEIVQEPEQLPLSAELQENIDDAYDRLHDPGSASRIQKDFPDLEIVYIDEAEGIKFFPKEILPFKYYYSPSADKTFSLCGVDRSTFICDGKLDRLLNSEDIETGRCKIAPDYSGDPRLS